MKRLLLAALLAACTGQNIDENFVSQHGALLARVTCSEGVDAAPTNGRSYVYDALMFLDGSVLVSVTHGHRDSRFYERSNVARAHAQVAPAGYATDCAGPATVIEINSGSLEFIDCTGGPPQVYTVTHSVDLDTECSGFNKSLFD